MITETEKQFFKTFGIKPKKQCYYWDCPYSTGEIEKDTPINERDCVNCTNPDKEVYPSITDRILLELIVILGSIFISVQDKYTLKDHILNQCIMNKDVIKPQVQTLLEEVI